MSAERHRKAREGPAATGSDTGSENRKLSAIYSGSKYTDPTRTSSSSFKPPMTKDTITKSKAALPQSESSIFSAFSYFKTMFTGKATADASSNPKTVASSPVKELQFKAEQSVKPNVLDKMEKETQEVGAMSAAVVGNKGQSSYNNAAKSPERNVKSTPAPKEEVKTDLKNYTPIRYVENRSTYLHTPEKKGTASFRITTHKANHMPMPTILSPLLDLSPSRKTNTANKKDSKYTRKQSTSPIKNERKDTYQSRLRSKSTPDQPRSKTRPVSVSDRQKSPGLRFIPQKADAKFQSSCISNVPLVANVKTSSKPSLRIQPTVLKDDLHLSETVLERRICKNVSDNKRTVAESGSPSLALKLRSAAISSRSFQSTNNSANSNALIFQSKTSPSAQNLLTSNRGGLGPTVLRPTVIGRETMTRQVSPISFKSVTTKKGPGQTTRSTKLSTVPNITARSPSPSSGAKKQKNDSSPRSSPDGVKTASYHVTQSGSRDASTGRAGGDNCPDRKFSTEVTPQEGRLQSRGSPPKNRDPGSPNKPDYSRWTSRGKDNDHQEQRSRTHFLSVHPKSPRSPEGYFQSDEINSPISGGSLLSHTPSLMANPTAVSLMGQNASLSQMVPASLIEDSLSVAISPMACHAFHPTILSPIVESIQYIHNVDNRSNSTSNSLANSSPSQKFIHLEAQDCSNSTSNSPPNPSPTCSNFINLVDEAQNCSNSASNSLPNSSPSCSKSIYLVDEAQDCSNSASSSSPNLPSLCSDFRYEIDTFGDDMMLERDTCNSSLPSGSKQGDSDPIPPTCLLSESTSDKVYEVPQGPSVIIEKKIQESVATKTTPLAYRSSRDRSISASFGMQDSAPLSPPTSECRDRNFFDHFQKSYSQPLSRANFRKTDEDNNMKKRKFPSPVTQAKKANGLTSVFEAARRDAGKDHSEPPLLVKMAMDHKGSSYSYKRSGSSFEDGSTMSSFHRRLQSPDREYSPTIIEPTVVGVKQQKTRTPKKTVTFNPLKDAMEAIAGAFASIRSPKVAEKPVVKPVQTVKDSSPETKKPVVTEMATSTFVQTPELEVKPNATSPDNKTSIKSPSPSIVPFPSPCPESGVNLDKSISPKGKGTSINATQPYKGSAANPMVSKEKVEVGQMSTKKPCASEVEDTREESEKKPGDGLKGEALKNPAVKASPTCPATVSSDTKGHPVPDSKTSLPAAMNPCPKETTPKSLPPKPKIAAESSPAILKIMTGTKNGTKPVTENPKKKFVGSKKRNSVLDTLESPNKPMSPINSNPTEYASSLTQFGEIP